MNKNWIECIKAINSIEQDRLSEILSKYYEISSVIWYPSAGFDVSPFFLSPVFNKPTHIERHVPCSPLNDSGIKPFPQEIYDITGKEPLLYVFSDLNISLLHERDVFGKMYNSFKSQNSVKLKDYAIYNGKSLQLDYYPWVLIDMIPFSFWGNKKFNILEQTKGYSFAWGDGVYEDYKNGWIPEWHGFYMQIIQKGREFLNHTYNVLYFNADNKFFFNNFLSSYELHPKILISIDEEGSLYEILNHIVTEKHQLMPEYVAGNREVTWDYQEKSHLEFKFKAKKIYSMGDSAIISHGNCRLNGLSTCAYNL